MKPSDYLKRGWTRGAYARDADGYRIFTGDDSAVCWCLLGSVDACELPESEADCILHELSDLLYGRYGTGVIGYANDEHVQSQAEAVELMVEAERRAAARLNTQTIARLKPTTATRPDYRGADDE